MDMEEKYASLQEEAAAKSSRLKEVWREFQQAKEEVPLPAMAFMYRGNLSPIVCSCRTKGRTMYRRERPCRRQ